ncbi:cell division protein FtsL [Ottowia sp.]|uniref:cell division protein FtsL n=1 Tax=Ottowia sp. TaxID=1898956 RepID=UPI0026273E65|nr:cell division protein FtsL [Ottowia sp.]
MTRLSIVLLAAVLVTAIYLVRVQYESRRLVTELDRATVLAHRLEVEKSSLEVEKQAQATSLRVEQIAQQRLGMRMPTPAITEYVTAKARVATASQEAAR